MLPCSAYFTSRPGQPKPIGVPCTFSEMTCRMSRVSVFPCFACWKTWSFSQPVFHFRSILVACPSFSPANNFISCFPATEYNCSLNVWQGISSPIHIEDLQAVAHPLAGILEMVFNVVSSRHHSPSP